MQQAWLGVDPGKSGAAALLFKGGYRVRDWPGDVCLAAQIIKDWRKEFKIVLAGLESVHAMPGQGVTSTFNFGCNLGQWMGVLATLSVPYLMPRSREWKRGLVKKSDGHDPKAASLVVARRLFPEAELSRKKDHGRAEALLLAWWAKGRA